VPRAWRVPVLRHHAADDVPWWRVVRADGSPAKGERQATRLHAEGVPFTARGRVDLRAARLPEAPD
jgi:methylated-DNA-protein-cysteine methyltransferase-like protein